ncbi:GNAT family N-acetyltransferase [Oceanisphaera sp.]|uniref:GNAT family N-acetyltransferase n=1 Tax=Oceanisphaera sp. TaxID=1929979 RepID=UPI003A910323
MMKIRAATKADMAQVFQLEQTAFGGHCYPDFLFRQLLELWPNYLLVAEQEAGGEDEPGSQVVGYILGGTGEARQQGWVLSLAVAEPARGAGIGKKLLQQLIDRLTADGCRQIRLTVHPDNHAAGLYQALGFNHETTEPDYFGPNEPRHVLLRAG